MYGLTKNILCVCQDLLNYTNQLWFGYKLEGGQDGFSHGHDCDFEP